MPNTWGSVPWILDQSTGQDTLEEIADFLYNGTDLLYVWASGNLRRCEKQ